MLYALLVLVRNALAGLTQVPAEVKDAALGMGYGRFGRLWRVELPLALPGIVTGLRLATVSTVALVTVGALIGQGGLGELILGGFRNNFYKAEIITGTVLCVALALVLDLVLAGLGRVLTPWSRRRADMSYFQRRHRLAQRPAELDQPGRPARPARRAPGDQLLGGAAGLPGRLAARHLARATAAGAAARWSRWPTSPWRSRRWRCSPSCR